MHSHKQQFALRRDSFTLIELLLVVSIMGVLAGIVIAAINPSVQLSTARDAKRHASTRELKNAIEQYVVDENVLPGSSTIPDGRENARPICRVGVSSTSCINLDVLVSQNFLVDLPVDTNETDTDLTGYSVYKDGNFVQITADHLTSDPYSGYLFWQDSGNPQLLRANLDGSNVQTFASAAGGFGSIAMDTANDKIYWYYLADGLIKRSDYNGSNTLTIADISSWTATGISSFDPDDQKLNITAGVPHSTTSQCNPDATSCSVLSLGSRNAIDTINNKIFAITSFGFFPTTYRITRTDTDGTNSQIVLASTTESFDQIAADPIEQKIYVETATSIDRMNYDGSNRETLFTPTEMPDSLYINAPGGKMYWVLYDSAPDGKVYRANLDGSNEEIVVTGRNFPTGLKFDTANKKILWTESNTLYRADYNGSNIESIASNVQYYYVLLDEL